MSYLFKRPGIRFTTVNRTEAYSLTEADSGSAGEGGGEAGAGILTLTDDGVLVYTGAAPILTTDGVLIYTPTPTMADTVMTIS